MRSSRATSLTLAFLAGSAALPAGEAAAAPIRLFAIGDSITRGIGDSFTEDRGGYRQSLSEALTSVGVDHQFQGRRKNPDFASPPATNWHLHWGRPGISADNQDSGFGYGPPYSDKYSLVDHFVVSGQPIVAENIRHPSFYYQGQTTQYDFRNEVWGSAANKVAPTHTLLHIGTNSITENSASVAASATQLNTLLRTFDLLDSTVAPDTGTTFMRSDGQILLAKIIPDGKSLDALESTLAYNEMIGDMSSDVYDGLSSDFVDRITVVDMFKVRVADVLNLIHARRTDISLATLTGYLQRDSDEWVDWVLDYNEETGVAGAGFGFNTDLLDDGVHPTQWGYEVMAQVWANVVPEPTALAMLAGVGLGAVLRRRRQAA